MENDKATIYRKWVSGASGLTPVLFLHSLGTDHRLWRYQQEAVAGRTFGVMDARGHGKSTAAQPVSVGLWVHDIVSVLDEAGVSQVVLCGISMGGVQALAFANTHPERVKGLVLADTFAHIPLSAQDAKISGTAGKASQLGMDAYADVYLDNTLTASDTANVIRPDLRDAISRMSVEMYVASSTACFTAEVEPKFAGIPTLVLIGEEDKKTPIEFSEEIVAKIPGSRLGHVANAAHLSNVDNPSGFNRYLTSFVEGVDAS